MTRQFDAIVLGQGLAGTAISWWLKWSGRRYLVVDRETSATSSLVAAGLITPITGQKLVKAWRFDDLWPAAADYYQRAENETGQRFFRHTRMIRLFHDPDEAAVFQRRRELSEYEGVVSEPLSPLSTSSFVSSNGEFEMSRAAQLDVPKYLLSSREHFCRDNSYVKSDVDVSRDIEFNSDGVRLRSLDVSAKRVFFCQGIDGIDNPWFRDVRFKPAKGEILTLRIPGLAEDRVVHCGVWLAPLGGELFKVGATYDWNRLDSVPTAEGRDEILFRLRQFLKLPCEVVLHEAAVRPIHRNQHPVLGVHPVHPQLAYFNGLGSKGSLQAPYFAKHLVDVLEHGGQVERDVDLNRKTTWSTVTRHGDGAARGEPGSGVEANEASRHPVVHVKPRRAKPLTEQAQDAVRAFLKPGDVAIDATAGNGHDTQFLAEVVGPRGTVFALDIQKLAIEKTAARLKNANLQNVVLMNEDHSRLRELIPAGYHAGITAIMFNLGYLPGGNKGQITQPQSTRQGVLQATELLKSGGVMTILAYTGHDGGAAEAMAVTAIIATLPNTDFEVTTVESEPGRIAGPRMFLVKRIFAEAAKMEQESREI